jgi:hypothetical protein
MDSNCLFLLTAENTEFTEVNFLYLYRKRHNAFMQYMLRLYNLRNFKIEI